MPLPDFLILGVPRGGTTSMWEYLRAHPDVVTYPKKEHFFFDKNYHMGIDFYKSRFPPKKKGQITGEATPSYFSNPTVVRRIKLHLPNAKFILLLRNPVTRARSHYVTIRGIGENPNGLFEKSWKENKWNLKSVGLYCQHLKRWFSLFPKEQFFIIKSEDFFEHTRVIYYGVLSFLNLRLYSPETLNKRFRVGPRYVEMDPRTRERIAKFYVPYNKELYRLLGRDFGWK